MILCFRHLKSTFFLCFFVLSAARIFAQIPPQPGAQNTSVYFPKLKDKRVAVVAHAASRIQTSKKSVHLIDSLLAAGIEVVKIFAPEHGFRSREDNGALIKDDIDASTQLPIISLHGKHRKPSPEHLKDIDIVLFDLQDVGVRFYTYLSTLHLVMEACAESNVPLLLLDRPNPNGHYVDGPVMEDQYKGFLGMHNIPIVHGLTLGEYAGMINGEGWLTNQLQCRIEVIALAHYTHQTPYDLPVRPSPNLPNAKAINLYPSLCLFEQTPISIGRGTEKQFQVVGHPALQGSYRFTPEPNFGAKYPKLQGQQCQGLDLSTTVRQDRFNLEWLLWAYQQFPDKATFFKPRFAYLAGNDCLEAQIKAGKTAKDIRESWGKGLEEYNRIREKYLLYPD